MDGAWWLPRPSKPLRGAQNVLGVFDSHASPPFSAYAQKIKGDVSRPFERETFFLAKTKLQKDATVGFCAIFKAN